MSTEGPLGARFTDTELQNLWSLFTNQDAGHRVQAFELAIEDAELRTALVDWALERAPGDVIGGETEGLAEWRRELSAAGAADGVQPADGDLYLFDDGSSVNVLRFFTDASDAPGAACNAAVSPGRASARARLPEKVAGWLDLRGEHRSKLTDRHDVSGFWRPTPVGLRSVLDIRGGATLLYEAHWDGDALVTRVFTTWSGRAYLRRYERAWPERR